MAHTSSVPLFWRLKKSKYTMVGSRCESCGKAFFPPRVICTKCRSRGRVVECQFSGNGTIESFTTIRAAPEGFERAAPYTIAVIRLDEGTSISGQVVGPKEGIQIGRRVRPVFRKITQDGNAGLIHYGIKWEVDDRNELNKKA